MVGEFISYQDYYMEIDKQLVEIVDKNKFFKPEFDLRKALDTFKNDLSYFLL